MSMITAQDREWERAHNKRLARIAKQQALVVRIQKGEVLNKRDSLAYLEYFPQSDRRRMCFDAQRNLNASVVKSILEVTA
jgi:hypothetical protein